MGILDKIKNWKKKRSEVRSSKTNAKLESTIDKSMVNDFSLSKKISKSPLARKSGGRRDAIARKFLTDHLKDGSSGKVAPGQLVMFNYFQPKTEEELEFYDAQPVIILFNQVKTKEGPRILGFNLHYYPPHTRYNIMETIFGIYKAAYRSHFDQGAKIAVRPMDYEQLIDMLESTGLGFGVRMYIPELMNKVTPIPPNMWQVAAYTEGRFRKRTRSAIMNYWKNWTSRNTKQSGKKPSRK